MLAWNDPDAEKVAGDRRSVRRDVDGVIIEVHAYGRGYRTFRATVPKNGAGVVLNLGRDTVKELGLDRSLLDEEGWTRVERR